MKNLSKIAIALCTTALSLNAFADRINHHKSPTTFLGPSLQGTYTSTLTNETAYSVLGEAGLKNLRIGGTFGIQLACNARVKISGEYLRQRINYAFLNGDESRWIGQGAFGAGYQYDIGYTRFKPQFDLNAYVSTAASKILRTKTGSFIDPVTGLPANYELNRRIAGSHAYGVAPGVAFEPWCGSKAGLELNYDNVRYLTKYRTKHDPNGLGGTARLNQFVAKNIEVGVSAGIRKPFNNYHAMVSWNRNTNMGMWALGVNGDYTVGKHRLPNTYNVGLSADLFIDRKCEPSCDASARTQNFIGWVGDPAVHMPQVLAISDQQFNRTCTAPTFSGTIPDFIITTDHYALTQNFTGSNLIYSINFNGQPNNGSLTIAGSNLVGDGLVNPFPGGGYDGISITATNACGSATSNAFNIAAPI